MKTFSQAVSILGLAAALVLPASAVQVTFQVNMEVQAALGLFDPGNDLVYIGASFNGWSETASQLFPTTTNALVYEGTFEVGAAGSFPNYKFIKNRFGGGVQWENNGVGEGGAQNRFFEVPAADSVLPVAWFNNITNVNVNHQLVTFQVNMSVQIAQGTFDPDNGTLWIAGDAINDWDVDISPISLTRSLSDTNVWTTTLDVTNLVGSTVSYKYILNSTWETIDNRTFIMPSTATNLPVVFFNNVTNTASPIPLTFSVNLGVQIARGNFNPENGDVVEVRGSFLMGPGSTWLGGFVLTNDPANPLIYSGTIVDTNDAVGSQVQYQFVLNNGTTWEATGNRIATLSTTNAVAFPTAFFSNIPDLGAVTVETIAASEAALSWTAGPRVRLQSSGDLTSWNNVADTEGQAAVNVNLNENARYFRLVGP
ncbi:MAG TPA: hypothetical protein VEH04_06790 [Verrucomicrobiae bacterium]|nr:hypothetical protein [Verrucomicrobiae bacterium]